MTSTSRRWKSRGLAAVVALSALGVTALGVTGCGSSRSSDSSTTSGGKAAPGFQADNGAAAPQRLPAGATAADTAGGAQNAGAGEKASTGDKAADTGTRQQYATAQRQIIYTGTMVVQVNDIDVAATTILQEARAAGGFVGADKRSSSGGKEVADLTLRVPADRFSAFVDRIGQLGKQVSRDLSTEDVSKQVQDLDARLLAAKASVERVRALLARAQSISDITAIEAELAKREGDLESLQAQKNNLSDMAALSTITVRLLPKDAVVSTPASKHDSGFLAGLKSGWRAFSAFISGLLTVVGALLPFLVLSGLIGYGVWWLRRRNRRPLTSPAEPAQRATPVEPAERAVPVHEAT